MRSWTTAVLRGATGPSVPRFPTRAPFGPRRAEKFAKSTFAWPATGAAGVGQHVSAHETVDPDPGRLRARRVDRGHVGDRLEPPGDGLEDPRLAGGEAEIAPGHVVGGMDLDEQPSGQLGVAGRRAFVGLVREAVQAVRARAMALALDPDAARLDGGIHRARDRPRRRVRGERRRGPMTAGSRPERRGSLDAPQARIGAERRRTHLAGPSTSSIRFTSASWRLPSLRSRVGGGPPQGKPGAIGSSRPLNDFRAGKGAARGD